MARRIKVAPVRLQLAAESAAQENITTDADGPVRRIEDGYHYTPPKMTWREKLREIRKILRK